MCTESIMWIEIKREWAWGHICAPLLALRHSVNICRTCTCVDAILLTDDIRNSKSYAPGCWLMTYADSYWARTHTHTKYTPPLNPMQASYCMYAAPRSTHLCPFLFMWTLNMRLFRHYQWYILTVDIQSIWVPLIDGILHFGIRDNIPHTQMGILHK